MVEDIKVAVKKPRKPGNWKVRKLKSRSKVRKKLGKFLVFHRFREKSANFLKPKYLIERDF